MIQISKYNKQHPLRVFEAFAGYGSQSLAFKYLKEKHPEFDFKVVGYSEIESSAIQAYGLLPTERNTQSKSGSTLLETASG